MEHSAAARVGERVRRTFRPDQSGHSPAGRLGIAAAAVGLVASVLVVVPTSSGTEVAATDDPDAVGTWRMPDRFGLDSNGDGLVDYDRSAEFLNPESWPVTLDACGSSGASPLVEYRWEIDIDGDGTKEVVVSDAACEVTHAFPALGQYDATLTVTDDQARTGATDLVIDVRDFLVISIGDSIASGEGNPDRLVPEGSFPGWTPEWQDARCQRTALAGPAQAARRLERRDPRSSVTFVHLACSGATILEGLVGPFKGIVPDAEGTDPTQADPEGEHDDLIRPQLAQIVDLPLGDREIDALLVSIGANDLEFSTIVKLCLLLEKCYDSGLTGPFPGLGDGDAGVVFEQNIEILNDGEVTFADPVTGEERTADKGNYSALAAVIDDHLVGGGLLPSQDRVFITHYFDPTTDDHFDPADPGGDGTPPFEAGEAHGWCSVPAIGLDADESEWAGTVVVPGLNAEVSDAATEHGWTAVEGIAEDFATHGYCARQRWTRTLEESGLMQANVFGAFHPNTEGHRLSYGVRIEEAMIKAFDTAYGTDLKSLPAPPDEPHPLVPDLVEGLIGATELIDSLEVFQELAEAPLISDGNAALSTYVLEPAHEWVTWLQGRLVEVQELPQSSIGAFNEFLSDPNGNGDPTDDGTFGGMRMDLEGAVVPDVVSGTYQLQLSLVGERDDDVPFHFDDGDIELLGFDLDAEYGFRFDAAFRFDPLAPSGERFALLPEFEDLMVPRGLDPLDPDEFDDTEPVVRTSGVELTYRLDGDLDTVTAPLQLGILGVDVSGTASAEGTVALAVTDPDGAGAIPSGQWGDLGAEGIFDLDCRESPVDLDATLTGAVPGGAPLSGTITVTADTCDPASPPDIDIDLGDLTPFGRLLPEQLVSGLGQLVTALESIESATSVRLPFLADRLDRIADSSRKLREFLLDAGLATEVNPLVFDPDDADGYSLQRLVDELAEFLGLDEIPVVYDTDTEQLRLDIPIGGDPVTEPVGVSVGDLLRPAGLRGVRTSGSLGVTPDLELDLGLNIDLRRAVPEEDDDPSTIVVPEGDAEVFHRIGLAADRDVLSGDLGIAGALNLSGRIGFLDVGIESIGSGQLLARADDDTPMVTIGFGGGPGEVLTLRELFDGPVEDLSELISINAKVPATTLTVTARTAGGETLASGELTIEWPDITDPDTLVLTPDADFATELLAFDFDTSDPRALFGMIVDALRTGARELDAIGGDEGPWNAPLPVVGRSLSQIVDLVDELTGRLDDLLVDDEAVSLQGLELSLRQLLADLLDVSAADAAEMLGLRLDVGDDLPTAVVMSLDLSVCTDAEASDPCQALLDAPEVSFSLGFDGAGGIVGTEGDVEIRLDYDAALRLEIGVELPDVDLSAEPGALPEVVDGAPVPFITDRTGLVAGARVSLEDSIGAHVGPFKVSLGLDAEDPEDRDLVEARLDARLALEDEDADGTRLPLGSDELTAWLSNLLPSDIAGDGVSCNDTDDDTDLGACARIPVYVGDQKMGDEIVFEAIDLLDTGTWHFDGVDSVIEALAGEFDWALLIDGMRQLSDLLRDLLEDGAHGAQVPLVGDALDAGADVVAKFDQRVLTPLEDIVEELENAEIAPDALADRVSGELEEALGGLLIDNTLEVRALCGPAAVDCDENHNLLDVVDVQVRFAMGEGLSTSAPIDFGLPGLRLQAAEGQSLDFLGGWHLDVGFGIDLAEGFYLLTGGEEGFATGFSLDAHANLPDVQASLAFIPTSITGSSGGNDLDLGLRLALDDSTGSGRLSLAELVSSAGATGPRVSAGICGGLDLNREIVVGGSATGDPMVPGILADLEITWPFADCESPEPLSALGDSDPTVAFNQVRIDVGSFTRDFLDPILGDAMRYLDPMRPVIDEIFAPVPVISDIYDFFGIPDPPTWFDLLAARADNELQMLRRFGALISFLGELSDTEGEIDLGSFEVVGASGPPPSQSQIGQMIEPKNNNDTPLDDLQDEVVGLGGAIDGAGLSIPMFESPMTVFQYLLGRDVDLLVWDAGVLEATRSMALPPIPAATLGPLSLEVEFGGFATVRGHFEAGYDTYGVRQALRILGDDTLDNSAVDITDALFQGIYLSDLRDGVDVPEIELTTGATVKAQGRIKVIVTLAKGGVTGGLEGSIQFDFADAPDGRLRLEDIRPHITRPICLFDVEGVINAFLEVFLDIRGLPEWTKRLVAVELYRATDLTGGLCGGDAEEPPDLATLDPGGILRLHMGPDTIMDADGDEHFTVRQIGPDEVRVLAHGLSQTFDGVNRIFADAGTGDDTIRLLPGVSDDALAGVVAEDPTSGAGDASHPFVLPAHLCSGGGSNTIHGGDGPNVINGSFGDVGLDGYSCGFSALFSVGENTFVGGADDDLIIGGFGDDTIDGGSGGSNEIHATAGDNLIHGGGGSEPTDGQEGNTIHGAAGDDTIFAGPNGDLIFGGSGDDTIFGGAGDDEIFGEAGDDTVFANEGDNLIHGGPGNDVLEGGTGDDRIFGDEGNNTLRAGEGHNELHGGTGDDRIFGGPGNDLLVGGDGDDHLEAGGGNNVLVGGNLLAADASDGTHGGANLLVGNDGGALLIAGSATVTAPDGSPLEAHGWVSDGDPAAGPFERTVFNLDREIDADAGRTVHCVASVEIENGLVSVEIENGLVEFDGRLLGFAVHDGLVHGPDGEPLSGLLLDHPVNEGVILGAGGVPFSGVLHGAASRVEGVEGEAPRAGCVLGGAGHDAIFGSAGGDQLFGGAGNDVIDTGPGTNLARGGPGHDVIFGGPEGDWLFGDAGDDVIFGGPGDDVIFGGPGDDWIEGNAGDDTIRGGGGDDIALGGSSGIAADVYSARSPGATEPPAWHTDEGLTGDGPWADEGPGDDTIHGDAGHDLLIGDDATVVPTSDDWSPSNQPAWFDLVFDAMPGGATPFEQGSASHWPGGAPRYDVTLNNVEAGGDDRLFGGSGDDHLYGGGGDDHLEGGPGDDYLEGGPGEDVLYGYRPEVAASGATFDATSGAVHGQNILIGGSSDAHPDAATTGADDEGDILVGGAGHDVIIGDNAQVERPTTDDGTQWAPDPITGGHARQVTLYDLDRHDDYDRVAGDDILIGIAGRNRMYGGPGDDYIVGGTGDDHALGGPGNDWIEGGPGDDDLVGGGYQEVEPGDGVGFASGTNWIFGSSGQNVIAGDNARIRRADPGGYVHLATDGRFVGFSQDRWIDLLDLREDLDAAGVGTDHVAGDVISAGPGNSLAFGQGGEDWISAGGGDDYVEGGAGDDVIFGDRQLGIAVHPAQDGPEGPDTALVTFSEGQTNTVVDRALEVPGMPRSLLALRNRASAHGLGAHVTGFSSVEGRPGTHGHDDLIGGSSIPGEPAGNNVIYGDGGHDVLAGDNAEIVREVLQPATEFAHFMDNALGSRSADYSELIAQADDQGQLYERYDERYPVGHVLSADDPIVRTVVEHDVGASIEDPDLPVAVRPWGDDFLDGGPGDDVLYGQDGDDELWGGPGDDHLIGGLGDDHLFGEQGDDVLIGDRGSVVEIHLDPARADAGLVPAPLTFTSRGAPFRDFDAFGAGEMWRRVDLHHPVDRAPVSHGGVPDFDTETFLEFWEPEHGGDDLLRGGPGDTVLYGGGGDDLLNGDSGADVLFGGTGDNAMWGGQGDPDDPTSTSVIDVLFGGRGNSILDYRPRPGIDPGEWFEATEPYAHPDRPDELIETDAQHHQGVDWIYGGWGRDVMQADLTANGPNEGDLLIDWTGAFNLYTHCGPAYGGHNVVRSQSPHLEEFLLTLAWWAGAGGSLEELRTPGTSGHAQVALVTGQPDLRENSGPAYQDEVFGDTPGHFYEENLECG